MAQRAAHDPKIEFVWNSGVDEVIGTDREGVTAVRVCGTIEKGATRELAAAGVEKTDIAKRLGISRASVYRCLGAATAAMPSPSPLHLNAKITSQISHDQHQP